MFYFTENISAIDSPTLSVSDVRFTEKELCEFAQLCASQMVKPCNASSIVRSWLAIGSEAIRGDVRKVVQSLNIGARATEEEVVEAVVDAVVIAAAWEAADARAKSAVAAAKWTVENPNRQGD